VQKAGFHIKQHCGGCIVLSCQELALRLQSGADLSVKGIDSTPNNNCLPQVNLHL
jgi:hypothetical protein